MSETIIMSPQAYADFLDGLLDDLRWQGAAVPIKIHVETFRGARVFVSQYVPEGQVFVVKDPASLVSSRVDVRRRSTLPAAWARALLPHCLVHVHDNVMHFQYEVTLRQEGRLVGVLVIPYKDLGAFQMPLHRYMSQAAQGDHINLEWVLRHFGSCWFDVELSS